MIKWIKQPVTKQQIDPLCSKFEISQILASILVRRGITSGEDILYFLEKDLRFQHEPFKFNAMEDAVERILQAKEEGEKILVFGDSDVDGITSTTILYGYLKKIGIDVQWRLPLDDDSYGLSKKAIDDFYNDGGTLIITVDCGISNNEEVDYANELGIDVIITDHHNPPAQLPNAIIIIDPKTEDSGYTFHDISGAAVAYKLVSALRFAKSDFYNGEICLFNITYNEEQNNYQVDCLKVRNLIKVKELHEVIDPEKSSIYDLKFPYFLQGQLIYVWDAPETKAILSNIFGNGIEFNLTDLKSAISKLYPSLKNKNCNELKSLSSIAKYIEEENSVINSIFNLYVTYCKKLFENAYPEDSKEEQFDLQLVGLAALADIMPMKNENRIFVKNCLQSIKKDLPRKGLAELFAAMKLNFDAVTSTDLSWNIIPALNATGRLGKPDIALSLLLSEDSRERETLALKIVEMNEERKNIVQNTVFLLHSQAEESVKNYKGKICFIAADNLHQGLTGLFAGKLMGEFNIPSIAISIGPEICVGSMRSCRGLIATTLLDSFGDIFINHGGHDYAAGFSFKTEKLSEFTEKLKNSIDSIELDKEESTVKIDAEIPEQYITPELFDLLNLFEPYGSENSELIFFSKQIKIFDAQVIGKKEPLHLKITFECGKYKFPAMFWGQAERLKKDIIIGNKYDILYSLNKNYFNGISTNQLLIKEIY